MDLSSTTMFSEGQLVRYRDDGSEAKIKSVHYARQGVERVLYFIEFEGDEDGGDYYYAGQLEAVTEYISTIK